MLNAIKEKLTSIFWENKKSSEMVMSEGLKQHYFGSGNKGLVLGELRLSIQDTRKNLLIIAPNGSGVVSRFIIPSLLNLQASAVVIDKEINRGDKQIFNLTSGYLKSRGYNIKLFQPANVSESLRFNPLARIDTNKQIQELSSILTDYQLKLDSEDIKSFLAEELANADPNQTKNLEYFLFRKIKEGVRYLIHGVIVALKSFSIKEGNLKEFHFAAVRKILQRLMDLEDSEVREFIKENVNLGNWDYPQDENWHCFEPWNLVLEPLRPGRSKYSKRLTEVILKAALSTLDLWSDSDIVKLTSSDDLEIENLISKKTVIYIVVSEEDIEKYSFIIQLFLLSCFKYSYDNQETRESQEVYYFLNAFSCLTPFPQFALWLDKLQEAKTSISIVLNTSEQIQKVYQVDPSSVDAYWHYENEKRIKGFKTRLFLGGLDYETGKYVEGIFDYRDRPFLAEELRSLRYNQALLVCDYRSPVFFEIKSFAGDKKLNQLLEWY